ncbi:MAG: CoA-binding protein, partial [Candidatus Eremiobacteraeota bacterium]|nr:CoA-binding protein [Candidatus Eremiobacteraeota bacterium]
MNTISPRQIGFNHRLASLTHTAAAGPVDRFQASAAPDFLHPRSVAVVGGTTKEGKPGNTILTNLLKSFQGETHIVNTRAAGQEMLGKPVYDSVKAIPGQVDLAVITVPGQYVQGVIEDCAAKGVKNAIVISAGFSETHDMEARAAALKKTAAENGIRVMGPNCLGLINTAVGLNVSFASTPANPGSIAMLSQSGGVMISMLGAGQQKNFGFSTLASLGNKMDLQESDFLKLLEADDNTRVVSIYTEGIKDGRRFLETAAQTSKRMPVLVLKGGRSASGAQAASSHTGSLAGQSVVFDAAMRKAGVIQVHDEEHMADLAMAFAEQPLPAGRRLTIVTNGGGPGIIATDNATEKNGLELSKLDPSTGERLLASLPDEGISVKNPIDIRGDAGAGLYKAALEAALQDPNTDMAMVILVAAGGKADGPEQVAKAIAELSQKYDKPVVASFMGGQVTEPAQAVLRANRIPVYPIPSRGTRALGA